MVRSREGDRRPGASRRLCVGVVWTFAATGNTAFAGCDLQSLEIPVQLVNQRPIATLTLNGTEVPMLVDTGAFFSLLTDGVATRLNLKLRRLPQGFRVSGWAGAVEAKLAKVDEVKLQGTVLSGVDFLTGINELGSGIGGVLGRNFLSMADTEFDLAHGVVRLMFPKGDCKNNNMAYWAGDAPVIGAALEDADGTAIRVDVELNGVKATAILDTGAPTVIKLRAARRAGVKEADMEVAGTTGGGGAGRVRSWTAEFKSFALGGETISNNRFRVDDVGGLSDDMLLGLDYFLSHRIYVSRLQRKLYATWNGVPVFARAQSSAASAAAADSPYAAVPAAILPDDADALARRGAAAAARHDYTRALQDLDRACELAPRNAGHLRARARVHAAMKEPKKALADLDAVLAIDASLHEARFSRAWSRYAADDVAGALDDLARLDEALPALSNLRRDMANLYAEMERVPDALRQWDLWMSTHGNDAGRAEVLNGRCWLRARLGLELDKALSDCRQAIRLADVDHSYHDSLGWTYLRMGDARRAIEAFDEAIALRPSEAWSLYGRSLAHRKEGKVAAADRDLAAARKADAKIETDVSKAGFLTVDGLLAAPRPPKPAG